MNRICLKLALAWMLSLMGLSQVAICLADTEAQAPAPPAAAFGPAGELLPPSTAEHGWMADQISPTEIHHADEEATGIWPRFKPFGEKPLGHSLRDRFATYHDHPDDPARHVGLGRPLIGSSWRNRPYHADLFMGSILLQNLISDEVNQAPAVLSGLRLGYDFDHYWGGEVRVGIAQARVTYPQYPSRSNTSQVYLFDYSVQYYPWGDSTWRPYATLGMGAASFQFDDAFGANRDQTQFGLPFGFGLKYYWLRNCSLRLELLNNYAFGSNEINAMHNLSFTGGLEYRFGAGTSPYAR